MKQMKRLFCFLLAAGMKRMICFLLAWSLLFSLAVCGQAEDGAESDIQMDVTLLLPPEPTPEVWYGQVGGSDLCLTLSTQSGDMTLYCLRSFAEDPPEG